MSHYEIPLLAICLLFKEVGRGTTNFGFGSHVTCVAMAQIGADRGLINLYRAGLRFGLFASETSRRGFSEDC